MLPKFGWAGRRYRLNLPNIFSEKVLINIYIWISKLFSKTFIILISKICLIYDIYKYCDSSNTKVLCIFENLFLFWFVNEFCMQYISDTQKVIFSGMSFTLHPYFWSSNQLLDETLNCKIYFVLSWEFGLFGSDRSPRSPNLGSVFAHVSLCVLYAIEQSEWLQKSFCLFIFENEKSIILASLSREPLSVWKY